MYRKKSLRIFKQKITLSNKNYLINSQPFVFFFNMIYMTYSDYLSLKNFSKKLNCVFLKKNGLFFFVIPNLTYLIFQNLVDLILVNDQINYVSNSNKKNFKIMFFPVKLKFLYCKFEEHILTREYIGILFQFIKMYEILVERNLIFILILKFFINVYVYLYNSIVLVK